MDLYNSVYQDDDDQAIADDFACQILLDSSEMMSLDLHAEKDVAKATKVQEKDAVSLFSRSTIATKSQKETNQSQSSDIYNEEDSNDTLHGQQDGLYSRHCQHI